MIEVPVFPEVVELNEQASLLIAGEKYEKALEYLEKAKTIDKNYSKTYYNLGQLYGSMDEYDKSEEAFKKMIILDKKDPIPYFCIGNVKFLNGEVEGAIENYNKAIEKGMDGATVYYNLGMIYETIEDYIMAIRNYSKAINKDKLNPEYRLRQVGCYVRNGNLDEALHMLNEMNKYCPDIFEGHSLKFEIYCMQENYNKAEECIDNAIKSFPEDVSFLYNKIKLLNMQKKYEEALVLIEKVKLMDGYEEESRNLLFEEAKVYAQKEDVEKAIYKLKESIEYENGEIDVEARFLLMNAYISKEKNEEALEEARIIAKEEEGQGEYVMAGIYYKGFLLKKLGREEEAIKELDNAKEVFRAITITNPYNFDAYIYRILTLRDLNEYEKALELINYVLEFKEDIAELHDIKAKIYEEMGDKKNSDLASNEAKKHEKKIK